MAKHDHGYKKLFSHPEMVEDLLRGFVHEDWVARLDFSTLEDPALAELKRAFGTLMRDVLLPARLPGVEIPRMANLEEVGLMLAENVMEWTREWEKNGFEKGHQKGVEHTMAALREVLLGKLGERFGALPDAVRRRVESLGSIEELAELISRQATAPSLASLGLV